MIKQNLAFVDIETTGLDRDTHEIIELGVVLIEQEWPENGKPIFTQIGELDLKIKPEHIENADAQALRVNGYNEADWVFAYSLNDAMKLFAEKTKDAIFVAHNVTFDYGFIEKAFATTGIENKMHYHKLDTVSIAFAKLHKLGDINRYSLRSLCEYFGIENKRAHSAYSDTKALSEVYQKMMSL